MYLAEPFTLACKKCGQEKESQEDKLCKACSRKGHPLQSTIQCLKKAKAECVGETMDHFGKCDETVDHAWRAIDRLQKRLEKNEFKPYLKNSEK